MKKILCEQNKLLRTVAFTVACTFQHSHIWQKCNKDGGVSIVRQDLRPIFRWLATAVFLLHFTQDNYSQQFIVCQRFSGQSVEPFFSSSTVALTWIGIILRWSNDRMVPRQTAKIHRPGNKLASRILILFYFIRFIVFGVPFESGSPSVFYFL